MGEGLIVRRGGKDPEPLVIQAGLIVEYFGLDTEIPFGWALCDGTGGRPDLRNRFIVGAGDLYTVESIGGFTDGTLVEHNHLGSTSSGGSHNDVQGISVSFQSNGNKGRCSFPSGTASGGSLNANGSHTHSISINNAGETGTNKNIPPYLSLVYIVKLEEN